MRYRQLFYVLVTAWLCMLSVAVDRRYRTESVDIMPEMVQLLYQETARRTVVEHQLNSLIQEIMNEQSTPNNSFLNPQLQADNSTP